MLPYGFGDGALVTFWYNGTLREGVVVGQHAGCITLCHAPGMWRQFSICRINGLEIIKGAA